MNVSEQKFKIAIFMIIVCLFISLPLYHPAIAQVFGPQEIKWLRVGDLRSWYSNAGAEIEYGRRGRTGHESTDQTDGLKWPAQYRFQEQCAAKSIWIGTTNFRDPVMSTEGDVIYDPKVISCGTRVANLTSELMPYEFKMIGRFDHPNVVVDGIEGASDNNLDDIVDSLDANLKPDRLIISKLYTSIGLSITRKILAFSNQYHSDYFIEDYTFENNGIVDLSGIPLNPIPTLTGVIIHFQRRYAFSYENYRKGIGNSGVAWGLNCISDVIGWDNLADGADIRATISWYGPHSGSPGWDYDVGCPDSRAGAYLGGTQYVGIATIHADFSDTDSTDDTNQPNFTHTLGSDNDGQLSGQYNRSNMRDKYTFMQEDEVNPTQADQVWDGKLFANTWTNDPGGLAPGLGYGPYTIGPNQSIHIVYAEGVRGISREKNLEVVYNWWNWSTINKSSLTYPEGYTVLNDDDHNEYKNSWVVTGKDSLIQSFRRAIANYQDDYNIPQPPPPPDRFEVTSGGDRIFLIWSNNASTYNYFDGYQLYRAVDRADTSYQLIFSCDEENAVHQYEDRTAKRGFDYYYYIVTKDDGSQNDIEPGVPLVSSKFYTMTNTPAYLRRPPGKSLADIRVVPNPYNIRARNLQFGASGPDRIAFYGIPPYCVIKIFTERGDLIATLDHTDSSGDELWDSLTASKQLVVSGLYIAYFEVTKDYHDEATGVLIYKKGENTFRKFIVIR
jgi:hypothetical protein